MPEYYYKDAQKQGLREYRSCVARGQHPYLPVLDDIVSPERSAIGVDLGLVQIPAELIVGTKTSGRTTAFARNFMPLLEERSEFGVKWEKLCRAHLQEGIRDPIKVYEYMNRFYVEEGNKRVSVLKYFNAVSISGYVIRVMPERNGSVESEIYYEFVAFYKYSKINFIEFSKNGSYQKLQRLMGKAPETAWSDDERNAFRTTYHYFRQAYQANGGKRLRSTVGDAMLAYMEIYGYQALRSLSAAEMKKSVGKVWEEITLQQHADPIDLKLQPDDKKRVLPKLPVPVSRPMKVVFVHDKTPQTSGWTYSHELGRQHVQRVFKDRIVTAAYDRAAGGDSDALLKQVIADGAKVIFTTSPVLLNASLRVAVEHPEVTILNCSLNISHRYIRTYYARMYEAKFIIGAIAGALAENDRVGYICDYPIYGMIAGINAFARGVQMVNPRARVYLEWSSADSVESATKRLTDRGIDLISSQDMARLDGDSPTSFGLARVNSDGQVNLAMPIWHWGIYYENILRSILNHTFQNEDDVTDKALNYYWGLSAGVVDLLYSSKLPDGVRKLAEILKQSVCSGICKPFSGPLTAQNGSTVVDGSGDRSLNLNQIITMDWLLDNVVGTIPSYRDLTPEAQATVSTVGLERLKNESAPT